MGDEEAEKVKGKMIEWKDGGKEEIPHATSWYQFAWSS